MRAWAELACPRRAVQQLEEQAAVRVGAQVGPGLRAVRNLPHSNRIRELTF